MWKTKKRKKKNSTSFLASFLLFETFLQKFGLSAGVRAGGPGHLGGGDLELGRAGTPFPLPRVRIAQPTAREHPAAPQMTMTGATQPGPW